MADAGQPADDDASTKGEASSAQEMLAPPAPGPSQTVRRLAVIAVILAIGGAAFGVAFTMLPDAQAITNPPAYNEPFSSCICLADLQNVDGLGELPGAPRAASQLAEDPPGLELGVRPFSG